MRESGKENPAQQAGAEERKRRLLDRIRNAPDRGTSGIIDWTREELYDRQKDHKPPPDVSAHPL